MNEISDRYRKVAGRFTQRAREVTADAWDNPAPCQGWVTRDVVRHMVEWIPGVFAGTLDLTAADAPSVDEDPARAWQALSDSLQAALDDPEVAAREFEMLPGRFRVDAAIGMFCLPDVLVHTWDLAHAAGLDETLDADEVHRLYADMQPIDAMLRQSGHYGPRVEVAADADEQTQLIAFTGRRP